MQGLELHRWVRHRFQPQEELVHWRKLVRQLMLGHYTMKEVCAWLYGNMEEKSLNSKGSQELPSLKGKEGPSVFCKRWGWEDFQGWRNSLCKSYRVMGEESFIRKPQTVGWNPGTNRMERRSLKKFQCKQTLRGRWKKGIHTNWAFICVCVSRLATSNSLWPRGL